MTPGQKLLVMKKNKSRKRSTFGLLIPNRNLTCDKCEKNVLKCTGYRTLESVDSYIVIKTVSSHIESIKMSRRPDPPMTDSVMEMFSMKV